MLLCMDLGGTAVKLGLVDAQGHIHQRTEANVRSDGDATPILTAAMAAAKDFLTGTGVTVEGIGVSATGQVDSSTGVVIGTNGAIPHYEGVNIREAMEEAFGLPVRVLNDANAAVLGECFTGAARGLRHVLMLTLGTGVGGGMVLDGRLYGGARGIAGELGHFPLERGGRPCTCGNRGCLEQYASTTALVRLACQATGEASLNGREIFARAARKDPTMLRVLAAWTADVAGGDGPGACVQPRNGADWRWRKRPGSAVSVPPAGAGAGAGDAVLCHWLTDGAGCSGKQCRAGGRGQMVDG